MTSPAEAALIPFCCRGCGSPLLRVDPGVRSFRVVRPLAEILIATHGGWAEVRCPLCNTHNRLEVHENLPLGGRPRADRDRSEKDDPITIDQI